MGQEHIGSTSEIAVEITRYLLEHPGASDNTRGVVRWWLNLDPNAEALERAESALQELVAEGAIERHTLPDGGVIYRRTRTR
jgi:hypothetical protein